MLLVVVEGPHLKKHRPRYSGGGVQKVCSPRLRNKPQYGQKGKRRPYLQRMPDLGQRPLQGDAGAKRLLQAEWGQLIFFRYLPVLLLGSPVPL